MVDTRGDVDEEEKMRWIRQSWAYARLEIRREWGTRAIVSCLWRIPQHVLSRGFRRWVITGLWPHQDTGSLVQQTVPRGLALSSRKDRELSFHFDQFVDRDVKWRGYVLTHEAWQAFKKSETHGKAKLNERELMLAEPLFGAKWGYEITIKSLWQEMAEYWSMNMGWFPPLRHTIVTSYWGPFHERDSRCSRVYLRALFKIRDSIREKGFPTALLDYTGMDMETKRRYLDMWAANNPART